MAGKHRGGVAREIKVIRPVPDSSPPMVELIMACTHSVLAIRRTKYRATALCPQCKEDKLDALEDKRAARRAPKLVEVPIVAQSELALPVFDLSTEQVVIGFGQSAPGAESRTAGRRGSALEQAVAAVLEEIGGITDLTMTIGGRTITIMIAAAR